MDTNELRSAVVADLESAGKHELAARVADAQSTMLRRLRELPGGAVAGLFEAFPHPSASFYAGVADGRVFYLTGAPDAFAAMVRANGLRVTDEQTAAELAREYVEITRTFETFTTVLDSADGIKWDISPEDEEEEEERESASEVVARVREAVQPPTVAAAGQGRYEVSVFVLHGDAVERRVLTVTAEGAVTGRTEDVFPDLPVPISL